MLRFAYTSTALLLVLFSSIAQADDLAKQMVDYFAGKWEYKRPGGDPIGAVDWKAVADGKAIAGPGTTKEGATGYALAGWEPKEKKWLHNWFASDGSFGHLEVTKFEKDVYYGHHYAVDAHGKVTQGDWQCKVIDRDHFELTEPSDSQPVITHWTRIRK